MLSTIKSEVRKLLTVRSTYFICLLTWILIAIFAFWVDGYKGLSGSASAVGNAQALQELVINAGSTVAGFISIISVLYVVHEYRYNMIMYSLTSSRSRSRVFFAKLLVISVFTILFSLASFLFAHACYMLGLSLRDVSLPAQDWNMLTTVGKTVYYNLAYAVIGLIVGFATRSIAAGIVFLLLFPSAIEGLIGLLLKSNAVYLPFAALERVIATSVSQTITQGTLSVPKAIGVATAYIVPSLIVTWILFLRRDAS